MFISFVVPFYNNSKQDFVRLIHSINEQTINDYELVVIDNGSKKEYAKFLNELSIEYNFKLIRLSKNVGYGQARNIGIKNSNSEYIAFIDSDDSIVPNYVEKILAISNKMQYDIISINFFEIKNDEKNILEKYEDVEFRNWKIQKNKSLWMYPAGWTKIVRRRFIEENNIKFYFDINNIIEDLYYTLNILSLAKSIYICGEPLYCYYHRNNSTIKQVIGKTPYDKLALQNYLVFYNEQKDKKLAKKCILNHMKTVTSFGIKIKLFVRNLQLSGVKLLFFEKFNLYSSKIKSLLIWLILRKTKLLLKIYASFFIRKNIKDNIDSIEYLNDRIMKTSKKVESKKDLLFLDFDNAIGDVLLLSKLVKKLDDEKRNMDVLLNIRFKGFLERLELQNINIVYRNYSLGTHYSNDFDKKSFDSIAKEIKSMGLVYNKIFYPCILPTLDSLIVLSNIKYNKFIKFSNPFQYSWMNDIIWQRGQFLIPMYIIRNSRKYNVREKEIKFKKNQHAANIAYEMIAKKKENITNIKINNFIQKNQTKKNTVCLMLSNFSRKKYLNIDDLSNLINAEYKGHKLIIVGQKNPFIDQLVKKLEIDYENYIDKTKTIIDLIDLVSQCEKVIAWDSSIAQIGSILEKEMLLILNADSFFVKDWFNYWYSQLKNTKITFLPDNKFI